MQTGSVGHDAIKFYPLQSTIDRWNTTTPNLWVILTLSFTPQPTNIYADEFPSDRKYYLFGLSFLYRNERAL